MKSKKVAKKKDESLVVSDGNFIFCDSRMVAEKFGVQHIRVIDVIERMSSKFDEIKREDTSHLKDEFDAKFIRYEDEYRGKKFTAFRMNKVAFSLISMRFDTKAAFKWQVLFAKAFAQMETEILRLRSIISSHRSDPEWLKNRTDGKAVRVSFMDTVKNKYVPYAKEQGSTHSGMFYMNFTKMINSSLFDVTIKNKNVRDMLDIAQLKSVSTAEFMVEITIKAGMELGLHYKKEINPMCKKKVESFAAKVGRTPVPMIPQLTGPSQCPLIGMEAAK